MPPRKFNIVNDFVSGAIMAATSIPQLLAYAEMVGFAGYRGLSTAGPSLLAWGLATGSPYMNSGVTSITALMAKSDLDGESYVAKHGEEEYVKLVSVYAFYVGVASILLAVIGFGTLAQKTPRAVRCGFKWGAATGVFVSAVPNGIFGRGSKELKKIVSETPFVYDVIQTVKAKFPAAGGFVNVANFLYGLVNPQLWALSTTIIFVVCTLFVMKGKQILPKFLPPGTEVIIATAGAILYSMYFDYQGGIVGEIPALDPNAGMSFFDGALRIPIEILDLKQMLTDVPILEQFNNSYLWLMVTATLFSAVNFLSIMGIASGFETEDGIPWSASRELVAQGVSNFVAAGTGSPPVSGSMSRSLVSRMTGATSQLACIMTALFWIYLLPYMSVMTPTPKAALASVIVSAVVKTVLIPKDLLSLKGTDIIVGWGCGIMTVAASPTIGFGSGLLLFAIFSVFQVGKNQKQKSL